MRRRKGYERLKPMVARSSFVQQVSYQLESWRHSAAQAG
jgi:hypothetical protein